MVKQTVALFFPGQGSQYAGMGKFLLNENPTFLNNIDTILEYSLSKLMLDGPEEELKLTANAQPAILSHSYGLFLKLKKVLDANDFGLACVLGHSVGEYSALLAAGCLKFENALTAVHMRGKFMQEASAPGIGKMYAIMRAPEEMIREACLQSSDSKFQVMPANFNEPSQIVISGHKEACEKAITYLEKNCQQKFRSIELNVSAPFHSGLMRSAALKLEKFFETIPFYSNDITYLANIDAAEYPPHTAPEIIKKNLIDQVAGSVLWSQSIKKLPSHIKCFEVGPGKVLTGLAKKINPDLQVYPLDSEDAFAKIGEFLL